MKLKKEIVFKQTMTKQLCTCLLDHFYQSDLEDIERKIDDITKEMEKNARAIGLLYDHYMEETAWLSDSNPPGIRTLSNKNVMLRLEKENLVSRMLVIKDTVSLLQKQKNEENN
jgi:hypothetical protein